MKVPSKVLIHVLKYSTILTRSAAAGSGIIANILIVMIIAIPEFQPGSLGRCVEAMINENYNIKANF